MGARQVRHEPCWRQQPTARSINKSLDCSSPASTHSSLHQSAATRQRPFRARLSGAHCHHPVSATWANTAADAVRAPSERHRSGRSTRGGRTERSARTACAARPARTQAGRVCDAERRFRRIAAFVHRRRVKGQQGGRTGSGATTSSARRVTTACVCACVF